MSALRAYVDLYSAATERNQRRVSHQPKYSFEDYSSIHTPITFSHYVFIDGQRFPRVGEIEEYLVDCDGLQYVHADIRISS